MRYASGFIPIDEPSPPHPPLGAGVKQRVKEYLWELDWEDRSCMDIERREYLESEMEKCIGILVLLGD